MYRQKEASALKSPTLKSVGSPQQGNGEKSNSLKRKAAPSSPTSLKRHKENTPPALASPPPLAVPSPQPQPEQPPQQQPQQPPQQDPFAMVPTAQGEPPMFLPSPFSQYPTQPPQQPPPQQKSAAFDQTNDYLSLGDDDGDMEIDFDHFLKYVDSV